MFQRGREKFHQVFTHGLKASRKSKINNCRGETTSNLTGEDIGTEAGFFLNTIGSESIAAGFSSKKSRKAPWILALKGAVRAQAGTPSIIDPLAACAALPSEGNAERCANAI